MALAISENKLDEIYECLDALSEDGETSIYVPSIKDLEIILSQGEKHLPFLLWITEYYDKNMLNKEEKEILNQIHSFVSKKLEIKES